MFKQSFLVAAWLICSSFVSSDEIENKVIQVAQDNLVVTLSKIPEGREKLYGFENRGEFQNCSIGKPYHVITLTPAFFSDEEIQVNKNYLIEQNEWRVPVQVNGENRLLLTVTINNEEYHVVDLGGMELAKELQQKSKDFKIQGNNSILRIYPLTSDFLIKELAGSSGQAGYIPLTSAFIGINPLKDNPGREYSLNEMLQIVKRELKNQSKN